MRGCPPCAPPPPPPPVPWRTPCASDAVTRCYSEVDKGGQKLWVLDHACAPGYVDTKYMTTPFQYCGQR